MPGRFDRRGFLDSLLGAGLRLHDCGDGVSRLAFSHSAGERRAGDAERRRRAGLAGEAELGIAVQVRQPARAPDPHAGRRAAGVQRRVHAPGLHRSVQGGHVADLVRVPQRPVRPERQRRLGTAAAPARTTRRQSARRRRRGLAHMRRR